MYQLGNPSIPTMLGTTPTMLAPTLPCTALPPAAYLQVWCQRALACSISIAAMAKLGVYHPPAGVPPSSPLLPQMLGVVPMVLGVHMSLVVIPTLTLDIA